MLVDGHRLLAEAVERGTAVGSFNTYNLEITRAIIAAGEATQTPLMLAVGASALDYAGFSLLSGLVLTAAREASVPVAVHLDHSPRLDYVERCLAAGYTSIMIDGSKLPFTENIALTRQAVALAGEVAVEGELGGVAGDEDASGSQATDIPMTDPQQAADFVERTGVASLAVAIGNAHGFYTGEPRLDFGRLQAIREAVPAPLVLHGATGISDRDLARCVELGVRKINVNTETRAALFEALQTGLASDGGAVNVTRLFGGAMKAMQNSVEHKLRLFSGRSGGGT